MAHLLHPPPFLATLHNFAEGGAVEDCDLCSEVQIKNDISLGDYT